MAAGSPAPEGDGDAGSAVGGAPVSEGDGAAGSGPGAGGAMLTHDIMAHANNDTAAIRKVLANKGLLHMLALVTLSRGSDLQGIDFSGPIQTTIFKVSLWKHPERSPAHEIHSIP